MCNYAIIKKIFYFLLFSIKDSFSVRCRRSSLKGPAYPSGRQVIVFHLCNCDKRKHILFLSILGGSLVVLRCPVSVEPSGTQVALFSCSVVRYGHNFICALNKLHIKMSVL